MTRTLNLIYKFFEYVILCSFLSFRETQFVALFTFLRVHIKINHDNVNNNE